MTTNKNLRETIKRELTLVVGDLVLPPNIAMFVTNAIFQKDANLALFSVFRQILLCSYYNPIAARFVKNI